MTKSAYIPVVEKFREVSRRLKLTPRSVTVEDERASLPETVIQVNGRGFGSDGGEPVKMISVFDLLSWRKFSPNQPLIISRQSCKVKKSHSD